MYFSCVLGVIMIYSLQRPSNIKDPIHTLLYYGVFMFLFIVLKGLADVVCFHRNRGESNKAEKGQQTVYTEFELHL